VTANGSHGSEFDSVEIDDDLIAVLSGRNGVLSATDTARDPAVGYERRAAALLAAVLLTTLYLADHGPQTWEDTDHPDGLFDFTELNRQGQHSLAAQLRESIALGAPDAKLVSASPPTLGSFDEVLALSGAEVVVAPAGFEHAEILERLQLGPDLVGLLRFHAARHGAVVVVAHPDGRITAE
jgi:hypothetical protein